MIKLEVLDAMAAAGCSAEQIVAAIRADRGEVSAGAKRQAKDMTFMRKACFVYGLICPVERRPFYIGISNNPWVRFDGHRTDPASAAWPKVRKLVDLGFIQKDILCVLRELASRSEALDIERKLIATLPGLVNRDVRRSAA